MEPLILFTRLTDDAARSEGQSQLTSSRLSPSHCAHWNVALVATLSSAMASLATRNGVCGTSCQRSDLCRVGESAGGFVLHGGRVRRTQGTVGRAWRLAWGCGDVGNAEREAQAGTRQTTTFLYDTNHFSSTGSTTCGLTPTRNSLPSPLAASACSESHHM